MYKPFRTLNWRKHKSFRHFFAGVVDSGRVEPVEHGELPPLVGIDLPVFDVVSSI
jgi:hypothetical protein